MLALTATATLHDIKLLEKNLCLKNPKICKVSPNRKNLFISKATRGSNAAGLEGYDEILLPIAEGLREQREKYPMTIIYMTLKYCGYAYKLFSNHIGNIYVGSENPSPKSCLIAQFHSSLYKDLKDEILSEIKTDSSRIRIIFATTALGMGVDAESIRSIIHIRPPSNLESYIQEIGRAGRDCRPSNALLYYNNSDLASNSVIEDCMKDFCRETGCLRKFVLSYFGFCHCVQENCCNNCCKQIEQQKKAQIPISILEKKKNWKIENVVELGVSLQYLLDEWEKNTSNLYNVELDKDLGIKIAENSCYIRDGDDMLEMFDLWDEDLCDSLIALMESYTC